METSIKEFQQEIADILNKDAWFGNRGISWLPEDTLNIEYEIKKNLGQTGMVAVVTTPSLDYQGEHPYRETVKNYTETTVGNTTTWTIKDEKERRISINRIRTVTPTEPYDEILEYVEFTGSAAECEQWINTGINLSNRLRIESEWTRVVTTLANMTFFGSRTSDGNQALFGVNRGGTNIYYQKGYAVVAITAPTTDLGLSYTVDFVNGVMDVNGETKSITAPNSFNIPLFIGATNANGSATFRAESGTRFKSMKIYDSGRLVRDFVPAKKNGVVCLFDKVSEQLYYNSNEGGRDFIAGPTVEVAPTEETVSWTVEGGCIPAGLDFTITPNETRQEIVGDAMYNLYVEVENETPVYVAMDVKKGGAIGKPYDREVEWLENTFATEQPYDAEVEYLESTGTQYIDTELNADSGLGYEIEATFSESAGGQYCGVLKRPAPYIRMHFGYDSTGTIGTTNVLDHLLGPGTVRFAQKEFDGDTETFHFMAYYPDYKEAQTDEVTESTEALEAFDTGINFYLFGRNDNGTSVNYISQKIRRARFYRNGVVVRDFIPVRKATTGYLYDRVSGRLFGNAGTGAFNVGPDTYTTNRISCIDTGINGSSTINVEITVAKMPYDPTGQVPIAGTRLGRAQGWSDAIVFSYYTESAATSNRFCVRYDYDDTRGQLLLRSTDFPLTVGVIDHYATINGTSPRASLVYNDFSNEVPLTLWAFNSDGEYAYQDGSKLAISNCKIWNSQEQLRDMIPVVKDGVGLFYDKVTGSLFYNQGVAPFTIGPDCTPAITLNDSSEANFTETVEHVDKGFDVEVSLQVVENPTVNRGKPESNLVATALDVAHHAIYTLSGYETDHYNDFSPSTVRQTTVASAGNKLLQVDARFRATPVL